jgi:hypothetical protein
MIRRLETDGKEFVAPHQDCGLCTNNADNQIDTNQNENNVRKNVQENMNM